MKYLLLALPATLLATTAFGQQMEYSARATASYSKFGGSIATGTTTVLANSTTNSDGSRSVNPFGSKFGVGGGVSLRAQHVAKIGLLTAFDLGYDLMNSRTEVNNVYYNSLVVNYNRPATGTTHLYTQCLTAFAGAGWRLAGEKLALDALVGPELAYVLNVYERGDGNTSTGTWRTDFTHASANSLDFRLRGDLTVWRERVGLTASYSNGFANYQPATTTTTSPDAKVRLLRVGLAYRLK